MTARAAQKPGGKLTQVLDDPAELQGAYDFLETGRVPSSALLKSLGASTMLTGASEDFMFVAVDGSSVSLTDRAKCKDFGSLGRANTGRGLKVISALAVSPEGVPIGLCAQTWWTRMNSKTRGPNEKQRYNYGRTVDEKETGRWIDTINDSCACADQTGAQLWFLLDRETDNQDILDRLSSTGHRFTVRGCWDRVIESIGEEKQSIRERLALEEPCGAYEVQLSGEHANRKAHISVRYCSVVLLMRERRSRTIRKLKVNAVWAREEGTAPKGEKLLDWLLLTNAPVDSIEDALHIIFGYTLRWRIEEFHKTWKSGACNVEASQLRSPVAATLWAIILAAVATRIERLKYLARQQPERPADAELSRHELRALILLKRQRKKRTESIPDAVPTIGQATIWIAELGGYTGKSSGGPPGSITIRRGLERVVSAALVLEALEAQERSDQ